MASAVASTKSLVKICIFNGDRTSFDARLLLKVGKKTLGDKARDLINLWRQKQQEFASRNPLAESHEDFWHLTGEALDEAMATLKIKNKVLRSRLMQAYLGLDVFPKVKGVLSKLKEKGLKTAIFCNASSAMLMSWINKAGIRNMLDHVLSSRDMEGYKPKSVVYQKLAELLKLQPQEICYVATDEEDLAAAQQAGFETIAVCPEAEDDTADHPGRNLMTVDQIPEVLA